MILIAHRGNTTGPNPLLENTVNYIEDAIKKGYDVEIDVWVKDNKIFLGHDEPIHEISLNFLNKWKEKLWCHSKNLNALEFLIENNIHTFSHENDDYVLTSKGFIWAFVGKKLSKSTICVMPERANYDFIECLGICSDFVSNF